MKRYSKLQVGDKIWCHGKDEMIEISLWLAIEGTQTDFLYEDETGKTRYGLIVTEVCDES